MAKIGEGDQRWIVEDRTDGTNVNNWHWSEKDRFQWAKKRVPEMLKNLEIPSGTSDAIYITSAEVVTGEAVIHNRKKKVIGVYEFELKMKWEGKVSGSDESAKGNIHFPEVTSLDDDPSDYHSTQTVEGDLDHHRRMKEVVRKKTPEALFNVLKKFLAELVGDENAQSTTQSSTSMGGGSASSPAKAAPPAAAAAAAVVAVVAVVAIVAAGVSLSARHCSTPRCRGCRRG
eukprot:GFYU01008154.1.p1 GENE.GFYU01008154.1~~GFYU01008154.1.p1  ORF type:complete len:230 (-),score=64.39 GFYU01008154.1:61-750(-)